jgi:hypothetical protein
VTSSGNSFTLNLPVTFQAGYAGVKSIYMYAVDISGTTSGSWQQLGTWTVPNAPNVPASIAVTPSSGSGLTQTFTLQYSDTSGASSLQSVWAWFGTSSTTVNSCLLSYSVAGNQLNLLNSADTAFMPATLGTATTLQNSECSLNVAAATVASSGNTLTLNLPMTFLSSYAGAQSVYLYAIDVLGATSGSWQHFGIWTVP